MLRPPPRSPLFPYTTLFRSLALSVNIHRAEVQHQLVLDAKTAAVHAQQVAAEQAQAHANAIRVQRLEVGCRSEEHTSELQSHVNLVCRLLLEKKKNTTHVDF